MQVSMLVAFRKGRSSLDFCISQAGDNGYFRDSWMPHFFPVKCEMTFFHVNRDFIRSCELWIIAQSILYILLSYCFLAFYILVFITYLL